jgi:hypothetical protein
LQQLSTKSQQRIRRNTGKTSPGLDRTEPTRRKPEDAKSTVYRVVEDLNGEMIVETRKVPPSYMVVLSESGWRDSIYAAQLAKNEAYNLEHYRTLNKVWNASLKVDI